MITTLRLTINHAEPLPYPLACVRDLVDLVTLPGCRAGDPGFTYTVEPAEPPAVVTRFQTAHAERTAVIAYLRSFGRRPGTGVGNRLALDHIAAMIYDGVHVAGAADPRHPDATASK